jgi:hypothetical protein
MLRPSFPPQSAACPIPRKVDDGCLKVDTTWLYEAFAFSVGEISRISGINNLAPIGEGESKIK